MGRAGLFHSEGWQSGYQCSYVWELSGSRFFSKWAPPCVLYTLLVWAKLKGEHPEREREHRVEAVLPFLTEPRKSHSIALAIITSPLRLRGREQRSHQSMEKYQCCLVMRRILVLSSLKTTTPGHDKSELASALSKP